MLLAETNDNDNDIDDEPETDVVDEVDQQYESTGGNSNQNGQPLAIMGVPMSQRPSVAPNGSKKRGTVPPQSATQDASARMKGKSAKETRELIVNREAEQKK